MNLNAAWTVRLARDAAKQLESLPTDRQHRVRKALREMAAQPLRGDVVALKGKQWKGRYRKRVGQYRIIFALDHSRNEIEVSAILIRSEKTYG